MSESFSNDGGEPPKKRKRGLTSITLGWIAERLRKAEKIKEQVNSGSYELDSNKVAASILNED